jgi:hypothetical protein
MITAWTKHLEDQDAKADFEREIWGSKRILDRLSEILDEGEKSLNRSEIDVRAFDNPNWAYLQAFKNGQRAVFKSIKALITLDQQSNLARG